MELGKAINLRVRPIQSVDLCYSRDGVIGQQCATLLGQEVQALDIGAYLYLGQTEPDDAGQLTYDSTSIYRAIADFVLSSLRNESQAVDVDTAVTMRWNSYLSSYSPDAMIKMREVFWDDPNDSSSAQWVLLGDLEEQSRRLNKLLAEAYKKAGLVDKVIKSQKSFNDNKATQYTGSGHVQFEGITDQVTDLVEFRVPALENSVNYLRARIGLRKEYLNAWRLGEMYGTDRGMRNELNVIDLQIKKLQIAYLDTFLIAPFNGVITGVFKSLGDYVRAGEPVLRVENDEKIYLVGTLKYRGTLQVGRIAKVSTRLFDAPGAQVTTVSGPLVGVRGHDAADEQWDVLIECSNRSVQGNKIFPLNYNFDFMNTTVEF